MKYLSFAYFLDIIFIVTFFNTKDRLTGLFCLSWIMVRLFFVASKILDDSKIESLKKIKGIHIVQLIIVLVLIGMAMFIFSKANSKFHFFTT